VHKYRRVVSLAQLVDLETSVVVYLEVLYIGVELYSVESELL
jgi:hypothetical protein